MDFLQLKYFLTVAKTEHMTKAAEELFISQPALSKMIKSLENELGVSLFDRVGKNIKLNEYGQIVNNYAKSVFFGADDMIKEINDKKQTKGNEITLSFAASTSYLSEILRSFKELHPQIDIKINQKPYIKGERNADLYIYSSLEPPTDSSETLLLCESCSLAVSSKHPLAKRKRALSYADISALKDDDFFIIQSQKPLHDITMKLCHSAGFEPHIALECDSHATIFSLVASNLGVAVFPNITWRSAMEGWDIKNLAIKPPVCRNIILRTGDGYTSDTVQLLREHIITFYKEQLK